MVQSIECACTLQRYTDITLILVSDKAIDGAVVVNQVDQNTKKKTKSDLSIFLNWLRKNVAEEKNEIEELPPEEQ